MHSRLATCIHAHVHVQKTYRYHTEPLPVRRAIHYANHAHTAARLECALKLLKCPISYYNHSSATFHLELLISGDINPNPGPETLTHASTNATQFHEISYSRNELLNLRNAPFTDTTALSFAALSQLNCFGILANRPQHTAP